MGFNGVAVFKSSENNSVEKLAYNFSNQDPNQDQDSAFRIVRGMEIRARNQDDLKKKVQKFRKDAEVLMVHGGDLKINRAACENPRVDIISHPYKGRRDSGINHVSARKAAENGVALELNLRHLLKVRPKFRYRILGQFRDILKLKRKFNFPLVISSGAHSIYDLHTPQDIIALSYCFGMEEKEAIGALSETPQNIMERSEMRSDMVVEGARILSKNK